jgi:hypothetical protein
VFIVGPTLLNPAAGATVDDGDGSELSVWEFDWSDVPGATQYHLIVEQKEKGCSIDDETLIAPSFRCEPKVFEGDPNKRHLWKVRALVNGTWSDWSEERAFTIAPLDDNKPDASKK